jgi:capsular polysaccharide biosynthesis protein
MENQLQRAACAGLHCIFGRVPSGAENLQIVGEFPRRHETWADATVWPVSGVVRRADGAVETETLWIREHLKQCGDYHSKWSWIPRSKRGRFFNLSLFWWPNYYHWHCDVLTRLVWSLPQLHDETKIILPPNLSVWQKRSLELLSLPARRLENFSGRRPWKVDQLEYLPPLTMTGDHELQSLTAMRDAIQKNFGGNPARPGKRKLYLTRKSVHARGVVNEAELLPLLAARGFEIVDCGALDYEAQIKLFSEAGTVVGPHGAAFTNLLWAALGTRVLEIFETNSVRRCYWSLCRALGHQHNCAVGESVPNPGGEPHLRIPAEQFADALDGL